MFINKVWANLAARPAASPPPLPQTGTVGHSAQPGVVLGHHQVEGAAQVDLLLSLCHARYLQPLCGRLTSSAPWIGQQRVQLDGMKQHVRVQASLPCGWTNTALIHKQASLKEMNPEQPFYLLDGGTQPIPPLFYAMLNKSLPLPLREDWVDYLWVAARGEGLVQLLYEGQGQGYVAWRVVAAEEEWQALIREGLTSGTLRF